MARTLCLLYRDRSVRCLDSEGSRSSVLLRNVRALESSHMYPVAAIREKSGVWCLQMGGSCRPLARTDDPDKPFDLRSNDRVLAFGRDRIVLSTGSICGDPYPWRCRALYNGPEPVGPLRAVSEACLITREGLAFCDPQRTVVPPEADLAITWDRRPGPLPSEDVSCSDRDARPPGDPVLRRVRSLDDSTSIFGTNAWTCAYRRRGPLRCTGYLPGRSALLPGSSAKAARSDGPVPGFECVLRADGSVGHLCAQVCDGSFRCMGSNVSGELGVQRVKDRAVPAADGFSSIDAASRFSCGVRRDGSVVCFGYCNPAEYTSTSSSTSPRAKTCNTLALPTEAELPGPAAAVSVGDALVCAVLTDRRLVCWGLNSRGQIDPAMASDTYLSPRVLEEVGEVDEIHVGSSHTCARSNARVRCWGANDLGQLGQGHTDRVSGVVDVSDLGDVVSLAVGDAMTCALRSDGTVMCWRHLRRASENRSPPRPELRTGVAKAVQISLNSGRAYARLADGHVVTWRDLSEPAVAVPELRDAVYLTTPHAGNGACIVRTAGDVVCVSPDSMFPPLPERAFDQATPDGPRRVLGIERASAFELGGSFGCARLEAGGRLVCVGVNKLGQLGGGDLVFSDEALTMPSLSPRRR